MGRKTKQESERTRERLLDAAEIEMQSHGVSNTSLACIAKRAQLTRGALYWHFADKDALLDAMIARTHLPLRDLRDDLARDNPRSSSRQLLREMLLHTVDRLSTDAQHRRVCDILLHRHETPACAESSQSLLAPLFHESREALIELCNDISLERTTEQSSPLTAADHADVILAFICGLYECVLRHGCGDAVERHPEAKIDAVLHGLFP